MELPGGKVTMQEIAERANVSISTVSRVLHGGASVKGAKRNAVLQAAAELNYRPNVLAQSLARGKTNTVGVLTQFVSAPIYSAMLQGILEGMLGSGYSPLFAEGHRQLKREQKSIEILLARQVDGLIILGGITPDVVLQQLAERVPLIVVGRSVSGAAHLCVQFDDYQGAYLATQYLIEKGHTQIAHITGILQHEDACLRLKGYKRALEDAGIPVEDDLIIEGNFLEQSGVMAVEMLLSRGKTFSAIFAANDQMAYGARLSLFRRGLRVPEDVSMVGFDDQPLAAYSIPPLTTVRQPAREMGQAAAHALLRLIQGEPFQLPTFSTDLIVRESVIRHY